MDYTTEVLTAVVRALHDGTAPRGTYAPAAAFAPGLATNAGSTILDA